MKLSLVLTVNNRPPEVSKQVADSFKLDGNEVDEAVIVLDRPTEEAKAGALEAYADLGCHTKFAEVLGPPGWKGPATAWNMGFHSAEGDLLYCISSEVVQDPENVRKAREICKDGNTVVFGACHNSTPENLVVGAEPGLLVSSKMPRPLGFIVCMPSEKVSEIRGFDEKFMDGFWYDDDDFFLRLWRSGVNFVFDDSIHGVHLHHERPVLNTHIGHEGINRNREYMLSKHGMIHPWQNLPRLETRTGTQLWWKHL